MSTSREVTRTQQKSLTSCMEELRQQQVDTDVNLVCDGGIIEAHKFVLRASCQYFHTMFSTNMFEKISGCVELHWCKHHIMESIVRYLYTGQLPNVENDCTFLKELIEVCHMLQLEMLMLFCWDSLIAVMDVSTFTEVWAMGVDFDLIDKNLAILDFAFSNMNEIYEIGNIENLKFPQFEKFVEYANNKDFYSDIIDCIFKWKNCSEREEGAVKLLQKIGLKDLSSESLHKLIVMNATQNRKDTSGMLMDEAVARLASKCKGCGKSKKLKKY